MLLGNDADGVVRVRHAGERRRGAVDKTRSDIAFLWHGDLHKLNLSGCGNRQVGGGRGRRLDARGRTRATPPASKHGHGCADGNDHQCGHGSNGHGA